jgi:hypothetical protein
MKVFLECHHGRGAVCSFWLIRKDPQRLGGAVDGVGCWVLMLAGEDCFDMI